MKATQKYNVNQNKNHFPMTKHYCVVMVKIKQKIFSFMFKVYAHLYFSLEGPLTTKSWIIIIRLLEHVFIFLYVLA